MNTVVECLNLLGTGKGESSCCEAAMSNAELPSDPLREDRGEEEGLRREF